MKKPLSLLLVLAVVIGLCACDKGAPDDAQQTLTGLQVGYARELIMPDTPVNMRGYGNHMQRMSTDVLDMLYATCIALTENGETVLLYSTDLLCSEMKWTFEARMFISAATGVPQDHIQIGATHSHTAPAIGVDTPSVNQWKTVYINGLVSAAKKAIADQTPTTMYGKKVMTENQNFVRHYIMEDGSYAGSNFGDWSKKPVSHVTDGDREMTLVKFEREGEKKDILLMNWQAHADTTKGTKLSADYVSVLRDTIESQTGMEFIFFLGASGDQNPYSRIAGESTGSGQKTYGESLAKWVLDAVPDITEKIEGEGIRCSQQTLTYGSNRYGQDRLVDATKVNELFKQTGDAAAANELAKSLGFQSVYQCNGIVGCAGFPLDGTIELNVVRVGGLGFVAAPYEMFSESGMFIKKNSPNPYTIISTVTNGYNAYFPTKEAFTYGCYESYTARFASGIAETTADKFIEMLKSIQ